MQISDTEVTAVQNFNFVPYRSSKMGNYEQEMSGKKEDQD